MLIPKKITFLANSSKVFRNSQHYILSEAVAYAAEEGPPHINLHHSFKNLHHAASQTAKDVFGAVREKVTSVAKQGVRVVERPLATILAPAVYIKDRLKGMFKPNRPFDQGEPTIPAEEHEFTPFPSDPDASHHPDFPTDVSVTVPEKKPTVDPEIEVEKEQNGHPDLAHRPDLPEASVTVPVVPEKQPTVDPEPEEEKEENEPEHPDLVHRPDLSTVVPGKQPTEDPEPEVEKEQNGQHPEPVETSSDDIVFVDESSKSGQEGEAKTYDSELDIRFGSDRPSSTTADLLKHV